MGSNDELFPDVPLYVIDTPGGNALVKWHQAKNDEEAWRYVESIELNVEGAKLYKLQRVLVPQKPAKR